MILDLQWLVDEFISQLKENLTIFLIKLFVNFLSKMQNFTGFLCHIFRYFIGRKMKHLIEKLIIDKSDC